MIQIENSATSLPGSEIIDRPAFVNKLARSQDALSTYLRDHLEDTMKAELISYSADSQNAKTTISAIVKNLNQIISGLSMDELSSVQKMSHHSAS